MKKILHDLDGVPIQKRAARFRTVISFVTSSTELSTDGVLTGMIATEQKGSNGFGYDPVFLVNSLGQTLAEISPSKKNEIWKYSNLSHINDTRYEPSNEILKENETLNEDFSDEEFLEELADTEDITSLPEEEQLQPMILDDMPIDNTDFGDEDLNDLLNRVDDLLNSYSN